MPIYYVDIYNAQDELIDQTEVEALDEDAAVEAAWELCDRSKGEYTGGFAVKD